jgi:hypothetical protein
LTVNIQERDIMHGVSVWEVLVIAAAVASFTAAILVVLTPEWQALRGRIA